MEPAMKPSEMDMVPQEVESEAVEPVLIGVPQGVPQAFDFAGENIYVRKCYPEYYTLLLGKLNKKHIKMLSITGTPGIGKSAFLLVLSDALPSRQSREDDCACVFLKRLDRDGLQGFEHQRNANQS
jgi:hypothetical protein